MFLIPLQMVEWIWELINLWFIKNLAFRSLPLDKFEETSSQPNLSMVALLMEEIEQIPNSLFFKRFLDKAPCNCYMLPWADLPAPNEVPYPSINFLAKGKHGSCRRACYEPQTSLALHDPLAKETFLSKLPTSALFYWQ